MPASRSQRIIDALKQLEQFLPVEGERDAVCALTGVRVSADPDSDEEDGALVKLTFPGGGAPVLAIGELYLKLKVIESVRFEFDSGEHEDGSKIGQRVQELHEHLGRKHGL